MQWREHLVSLALVRQASPSRLHLYGGWTTRQGPADAISAGLGQGAGQAPG